MPAFETIAAPATPPGESALALLRVSGPLCQRLLREALGQTEIRPRQTRYGSYRRLDGSLVDCCLFTFFRGPRSFTGEDMLELTPHGNPFIVQMMLEDLLARGCVAAEPGAFTRQAFLNGKLDLTQAEAIRDIIAARSAEALAVAHRQLSGAIGKVVQELLDSLLRVLAWLEAYIDFPDEDLPPETTEGPLQELADLIERFAALEATSAYKNLLHEGVRIVIVGLPNAGKSSLMNALCGEERVLVDPAPGTTRDYVEHRFMLDPFLLRLIDTAGLREAEDQIELKGIGKTLEQIQQADVLLVLTDATLPCPSFADELLSRMQTVPTLWVSNKWDLPAAKENLPPNLPCSHCCISALTGAGLDDLRDSLRQILRSLAPADRAADTLVGARHAQALAAARKSLQLAREAMLAGDFPELIAPHLRDALMAVEEIVGKVDNEKMLDALFGSFCIGK